MRLQRIILIAMVFEPGAGDHQQDEEDDKTLFGRSENENTEKAFHRFRVDEWGPLFPRCEIPRGGAGRNRTDRKPVRSSSGS